MQQHVNAMHGLCECQRHALSRCACTCRSTTRFAALTAEAAGAEVLRCTLSLPSSEPPMPRDMLLDGTHRTPISLNTITMQAEGKSVSDR